MLGVSARDFGITQKRLGCAVVPYNKGFAPTPAIRRGWRKRGMRCYG